MSWFASIVQAASSGLGSDSSSGHFPGGKQFLGPCRVTGVMLHEIAEAPLRHVALTSVEPRVTAVVSS